MATNLRQNTLFVSEDWKAAYEALENANFTAYDADSLREAMIDYVRETHPEEFTDWIGSSEFVIKLDILAWLAQNLAYRTDLNSRENFLATAERRESLLRLAQNVSYTPSRVTPASGEVKLVSIATDQTLFDGDGNEIVDRVVWNDTSDANWFEKWTVVANAALGANNPYGRPVRRFSASGSETHLYRMNSLAPPGGTYPMSFSAGGRTLDFDIINPNLDPKTGLYEEFSPDPGNAAWHLLYRTDGLGLGSSGSGFFLPFRQGSLAYQDENFSSSVTSRIVDIDIENINDNDVWVTRIDSNGNTLESWDRVSDVFGGSLAFNTLENQRVFEVITRSRDSASIRFGDGKYGKIPIGLFRIWYRVSDPLAQEIRTSDVQGKNLVIPYAKNGKVYNLTMTFSLTGDITNAAAAESNEEIRRRANKVFYTQDRMVSGRDYNSLPLREASLLKVKAVNRTFSGHGIASPLGDPTGAYNNVKLIGEDGRIYSEYVTQEKTISADPNVLSLDSLITNEVQDLLATEDKVMLYYNEYDEHPLTRKVKFVEDALISGWSRGRFRAGEDTGLEFDNPVGGAADSTDPLRLVGPDAMVRFTDRRGPTLRIESVLNSGIVTSGIILRGSIPNGSKVYSVLPVFRRIFTEAERQLLVSKLGLKRSFGIRWDHTSTTWKTVNPEDLDTTSQFSTAKTGDTTKANQDASWFIRLEYLPESTEADESWKVVSRGLEIYAESDNEVDFFYASTEPIVDPNTGRSLRDSFRVLDLNESRDSLRRRGVSPSFGADPVAGTVRYTGDGTTTDFRLEGEDLEADHLFVQIDGVLQTQTSFTLKKLPGGDEITLSPAPADGADILIRYNPRVAYARFNRVDTQGDGSTTAYELGIEKTYQDNCLVFDQGLAQKPGEDYTVFEVDGFTSRVRMTLSPEGGNEFSILAMGATGPAFASVNYEGDASQTNFNTNMSTPWAWVFVDGVRTEHTLNTNDALNSVVIIDPAPADGAEIHIRAPVYPEVTRVTEGSWTAESGDDSFTLAGAGNDSNRALFWVDGIEGEFSFEDGVFFPDASLSGGELVRAIYIHDVASPLTGVQAEPNQKFAANATFIDADQKWHVSGPLRHADGYVNSNGIQVTNVLPGETESDNPFLFRDFVIKSGTVRDKVLWRRITVKGHEQWEPISESTVPRGTHEDGRWVRTVGQALATGDGNGDVHLTADGTWLVASTTTNTWAVATDSTAYRERTGRSKIKFAWEHYTADGARIDPSPTNIIDMFVLTSGYNALYRSWLAAGSIGAAPVPPTSDSLRNTYSSLEDLKMVSDSIVFHPARFKPLFGAAAAEELRAKFFVVRSPTTSVPDSDIKLRVLTAVRDYFSAENWDFGETFMFSELSAFLHQELATVISSVVVVPTKGGEPFGRLYQVRAEPDEIFASALSVTDITVESSLVDSRIRIK